MTLIQLIDHLTTILEDHGGQDMEVQIDRRTLASPGELWSGDIEVDIKAKTITFA